MIFIINYSFIHHLFSIYLIYLGTGPWNLKLARKDQIHSNFPKYGFEAPRVHWCTRKNFWWSRGGARFCDHMIKNVDFRQYRQFLDPSLSDVPILLFKEDYDDIYRFLISRKKYFFGQKKAIFGHFLDKDEIGNLLAGIRVSFSPILIYSTIH